MSIDLTVQYMEIILKRQKHRCPGMHRNVYDSVYGVAKHCNQPKYLLREG